MQLNIGLYTCIIHLFLASEELPEAVIIRDLVYAFQGIEGRWIRFDPTKEGYRINPQVYLCSVLHNVSYEFIRIY